MELVEQSVYSSLQDMDKDELVGGKGMDYQGSSSQTGFPKENYCALEVNE